VGQAENGASRRPDFDLNAALGLVGAVRTHLGGWNCHYAPKTMRDGWNKPTL
jgi:hypothetical protein